MQEKVKQFMTTHNLSENMEIRYMDLVSEIGELGKEIIKSTQYGTLPFATTIEFENELGDCLFALLAICHSSQVDSQTVLQSAMQKYSARFLQTGQIGSDSVVNDTE